MGSELFVPLEAFPTFNKLAEEGEIVVRT